MGKLIKNHWARLIILTASLYQIAAAISCFFWPKLFFDFATTNLDAAVRPIPILQIINLLLGLLSLAWEWPLPWLGQLAISSSSSKKASAPAPAQSRMSESLARLHRSISARLLVYPLNALAALLIYQGTNAGLYYIIGMGVYFWGFSEGEVVMGVPWTLPRRRRVRVVTV